MTAALIGSAVALTAYALGFWTARTIAGRDFGRMLDLALALRRREEAKRERGTDERASDRYRLAWLSARRRAQHGRRYARVLNHTLAEYERVHWLSEPPRIVAFDDDEHLNVWADRPGEESPDA